MPTTPEQQRSINGLLAQVHTGNVLQVAASLRKQADDVERALYGAQQSLRLQPCGADPVSIDAAASFQKKIDLIVAAHWAQHAELRAAVEALRLSAISYGFTDQDLEDSFRSLVEQ
ncbi:PE domain-containing protein [Pseudonocardia sp. NPDC046786]|uniref:PE domain-containing protein n=1 Tax=Pseudonocardia sp. NPDC046786 TaxID=3155471 RepID=UPI0033F1EF92